MQNIWNNIKRTANASKMLKYFPDYSGKTLPSKKYLMNVINTIDRGLMIRTIQEIKKKKEKRELETNPIMITDFYKDMLLDFESLGTNTHQIGIGNILHFDARKCNICLEEMKPSHSQKFYKCNKHKGHSRCVKGYYESVRNDSRYICPLRCPKP